MATYGSFVVLLVSLTINTCCGGCVFDGRLCKNGGYCDNLEDRCICPPAFAGSRCETGVKYMLDECSRTVSLNNTDTLVMKSQSSKYMPTYASCNVHLKSPTPYHQILVNIVEFKMHFDCSLTYLQIGGGDLLCGASEFTRQYVLPNEATMHLQLGLTDSRDEHLGFIITISTFLPPEDGFELCEFRCNNLRCISFSLYHNGFDDCGDGSDEPVQEFCYDNTNYCNGGCIPDRWECDCNADCNDGTDEWGCSCPLPAYGRCDVNHFWCESSKTCLSNSIRCNGIINCMTPSDENECFLYTTPKKGQCQESAHLCESSYTCIPNDYVCDNYIDCPDGSDESNCRMSGGVITGVVLASVLSMVCFVGAALLVVSILMKKRQIRMRRSNIRTVSAYVPPEPQNIFTNCDIPPSYDIAVGIDGDDPVKEGLNEEVNVSPELNNTNTCDEDDNPSPHQELFDDCHELPLMDAVSEISKTQPPNTIIQ